MTNQYVTQTIMQTARDILGRDVGSVDRFDEIGFDSLECIEFTTAIEDAFRIEISCAERVDMESIGDAVALVTAKTDQQRMPLAA